MKSNTKYIEVIDRYAYFVNNRRFNFLFLVILSIFGYISTFPPNENNFSIFYYSYIHLSNNLPLYILYPNEHFDYFFYNPVFATLMGPFTLFPVSISRLFWITFLTIIFEYTLSKLPLKINYKFYFLLLVFFDFFNNLTHMQGNIPSVACMLLCWVYFEKENFFLATFFTVMAFAIKGYAGIIGLIFLFTSIKNIKKSFIYGLFWFIIIHSIPLLVTKSIPLLVKNYKEWIEVISSSTIREQYSFFGINQVLNLQLTDNVIYIIALIFLLIGLYIQKVYFKNTLFLTSWLMIIVVLFNQSAESPTYIFAVVGMTLLFLYLKNKYISIGYWIAMSICTFFPVGVLSFVDTLKYEYFSKAFAVLFFAIIVIITILSKKTEINEITIEA